MFIETGNDKTVSVLLLERGLTPLADSKLVASVIKHYGGFKRVKNLRRPWPNTLIFEIR